MYHGKMLVIYDPSRVMVATIDDYNHNGAGLTLKELIDKYDGVAGVNGGQYEDTNGMGIGGWPEGIVISEGELRMGVPGGTYDVYGLTNDNVLVVGRMTAQHAMDIGVRDAVSFGPALIVNGVPANYSGSGGGLNPRTAIGQREDGAILLLVIEGRKTSSMGATMADLIDVMLEFGAVNAANLDGGMSSAMWLYDDEVVSSSSIRTDRQMPTAFIVLPQGQTASEQTTEE
jgi:exopolysaccharide biosynthesis protein